MVEINDTDDWIVSEINIPDGMNDGFQIILNPHLSKGRELEKRGYLREAIEEYAKEHNRTINSLIDADIVQSSYWFKGRAYRQLGEVESAIEALQKSRELFRNHGIGASPHEDLAEIFIAQCRLDEAIEICQECLEKVPAWPIKQLLKRAIELKEEQDRLEEEN